MGERKYAMEGERKPLLAEIQVPRLDPKPLGVELRVENGLRSTRSTSRECVVRISE
jgi:hypothetical protein